MPNLINILERAEKVLVVSHHDPDGDALGSSLALMHLLGARGAEVHVYSAGPIPAEYRFLPGLKRVSDKLPPDDWFDLAVICDCHEYKRTGPLAADYLAKANNLVVIDHHQGEVNIGQAAWVDSARAATCEMITMLAGQAGWELGKDAAMCLFVGIQTDTGSFRYSNCTPETFRLTADLVEAGADPWQAAQEVYSTTLGRMRLWGRVVEDLDLLLDGRLAVGMVSLDDFAATGCGPEDLENVVEGLRAIRGVEVSLLLRQRENGDIKISMRSRGAQDVSAVAIALGGGGHHNAAGALVDGRLDQVRKQVQPMLLAMMEDA